MSKRVYFPGLNGLRFIAAFAVILGHIESLKARIGLNRISWSPHPDMGKLGVVLFFVLSGFLITYLLMEEEQQTNTISIKDFYVRRLLRIWPLYYLIIFLGFFVLCNIPFFSLGKLTENIFTNFWDKFLIFFFFLPNVGTVLYSPIPYISQTWSVGVEEQFYLMWPWLMKLIKNKIALLVGVLMVYLFIKYPGVYIVESIMGPSNALRKFSLIWAEFSIGCMAIGGFFAYCLHKDLKILKYFFHPFAEISAYLILGVSFMAGFRMPYFNYEFFALLFGIIILNCAANKKVLVNLENKYFNYLGKISYGLYIYHPIAIIFSLRLLNVLGMQYVFLQYIFSIGLTIIVSGISYQYFEKYFIQKKVKFSKIISGN